MVLHHYDESQPQRRRRRPAGLESRSPAAQLRGAGAAADRLDPARHRHLRRQPAPHRACRVDRSMDRILIIENPRNWDFHIPGVTVVAARDYLTEPRWASETRLKVFNLCRTYSYQTVGYYVSLLAAARGHRPLPSVSTIQDMRTAPILRIASERPRAGDREGPRAARRPTSSRSRSTSGATSPAATTGCRRRSSTTSRRPSCAPSSRAPTATGSSESIRPVGSSEIPAEPPRVHPGARASATSSAPTARARPTTATSWRSWSIPRRPSRRRTRSRCAASAAPPRSSACAPRSSPRTTTAASPSSTRCSSATPPPSTTTPTASRAARWPRAWW